MKFNTRISFTLALVLLGAIAAAQQPPAAANTATAAASTTTESNTNDSPTTAESTPTTIGADEPVTSTTDTIGVGDTTPDTEEEDNPPANGAGLEAKSIAGNGESALENSLLPSGAGDTNARLVSVDQESPTEESTSGDGEASQDESIRKSPTKGNLPTRLNMSQVDANYVQGTRDEAQTTESWRKISKKLKKGIGSIIGALVPHALNMSAEAKISSECSGAMLKWVLSMNQLKAWALRMLDAAGKPVAGLLEGSMTMFGNYRQCLKIRAPDDDEIELTGEFHEYFRGKYCIIQAKPWLPEKSRFYNLNTKLKSLMQPAEDEEPPQWWDRTVFEELNEWLLAFNFVDIRYDICVPSQCSREDIQKAVNYLVQGIDLKARVLRCEMDPPNGTMFSNALVESGSGEVTDALRAVTASAEQQTYLASFGQLGWILLPLVATCIVLLATSLSIAVLGGPDDDDEDDRNEKTKLKRTIKNLSLGRSIGSHLSVDYDQLADDKPLALYGIKFIIVMWVLLVESAVNLRFEFLRELMMLKDLIFWWPMQVVINSSLQFDSIILLTAFTMAYKNVLNDGANQARALTKYIIDKYIRLMPSVMVMVAIMILLPLIYRGPVWNDYVVKQSAVCQSTGWLNTVFLQNYLPYKEICLPQTWLFCVEFQLVLLMAPLIYYLNKNYMASTSGNRQSVSTLEPSSKGQSHKQQTGNKQQDCKKSKSLDATKPFFWITTVPGLLLLACIGLGMAGSFYDVYANELPPSWFYTMADPDSKAIYFGVHLTKLWTHLAVFAAGLLAGIECRRASKNAMRGYGASNIGLLGLQSNSVPHLGQHRKGYSFSSSSLPETANRSDLSLSLNNTTANSSSENIDLESGTSGSNLNPTGRREPHKHGDCSGPSCCSMLLNLLAGGIALCTMGAIIFSTHDWALNDLPQPLVAGLFDACSRLAWSMAFICILYMVCVPDNQRQFNCIAKMLGHPVMVCLGKLSFLIYLIHPFVHLTVLAIQEQPIYSSWLMLFHVLIGNITITVILSSLMSLFVEMPCRNVFRRCGTSILLTHNLETPSVSTPTSSASTASTFT